MLTAVPTDPRDDCPGVSEVSEPLLRLVDELDDWQRRRLIAPPCYEVARFLLDGALSSLLGRPLEEESEA